MTGVRFTAKDDLEWDGCHPNVCTIYRVWRGDLQVFRDTGTYTQDPDTVPGARLLACGSSFPFLSDPDRPFSGQAYFYLIHAVDDTDGDAAGGSLGVDSALEPRRISRNCYTEM